MSYKVSLITVCDINFFTSVKHETHSKWMCFRGKIARKMKKRGCLIWKMVLAAGRKCGIEVVKAAVWSFWFLDRIICSLRFPCPRQYNLRSRGTNICIVYKEREVTPLNSLAFICIYTEVTAIIKPPIDSLCARCLLCYIVLEYILST